MLFLLLRPLLISFYSFPCRALHDGLAASHLHGYSGSAYPRHYFYAIAWTNAHGFGLIFPLTAPNGDGGGPAKTSPRLSAPPCIEQGNRARLSTRGEISTTYGVKNGLVTSVDWKHGIRIDRYLCVHLIHSYSPSRSQYSKTTSCVSIIHYLCICVQYILCNL
jgi:hypothetical protein